MRTIPTNYTEAFNSVNSNNWILAMRREFDSLIENDIFEWQKAPRNINIVGCKYFFFTIKSKSDGSDEYKAHFIAKITCKSMERIIEKVSPRRQLWLHIRLQLQIAVQ